MMTEVHEIDWTDLLQGFPAFLTTAGIAMTYSISSGIGLGFIAYGLTAIVTGKVKEIKPLMWVAIVAFIIYFLMS